MLMGSFMSDTPFFTDQPKYSTWGCFLRDLFGMFLGCCACFAGSIVVLTSSLMFISSILTNIIPLWWPTPIFHFIQFMPVLILCGFGLGSALYELILSRSEARCIIYVSILPVNSLYSGQ